MSKEIEHAMERDPGATGATIAEVVGVPENHLTIDQHGGVLVEGIPLSTEQEAAVGEALAGDAS